MKRHNGGTYPTLPVYSGRVGTAHGMCHAFAAFAIPLDQPDARWQFHARALTGGVNSQANTRPGAAKRVNVDGHSADGRPC